VIFIAVLAGIVVSVIGTPIGVSGAVFLLPVQISLLDVTGPAVSATNLLFNIISTPLALLRLTRHPDSRRQRLGPVVAAGIPGAALGALARVTVLADPTRFRVLVAAVLLVLGCRLLWRAWRHRGGEPAWTTRPHPTWALVALAGLAAAIGSLLGIGGGSLLAPILVALYRYPGRDAAVLALTVTLTTSVTGLTAYTLLDAADIGAAPAAPYWDIGLALGAGGLVGAMIGAGLQHRISDRLLTTLLGAVATLTAVSYLVRT
jgi:uncharacterized membrane protein YfcA